MAAWTPGDVIGVVFCVLLLLDWFGVLDALLERRR